MSRHNDSVRPSEESVVLATKKLKDGYSDLNLELKKSKVSAEIARLAKFGYYSEVAFNLTVAINLARKELTIKDFKRVYGPLERALDSIADEQE